jgi:hypothetical protein
MKCAPIERFNRTLKTLMWKQFTEQNTRRWIEMLPVLLTFYNNKKHSALGIVLTPVEASKKEHEYVLHSILYGGKNTNLCLPHSSKLLLGDWVRISRWKGKFEKGYLPNWSQEIFQVVGINQKGREPPTFLLKDKKDEYIQGSFYEHELQKTNLNDIFLVEEVLDSKVVKGKKQYFVKWLGYPDSQNSWIDQDDLVD